MAYRTWGEALPHFIDVCPIQLPGRDARLAEAAYTDLIPLVQILAQDLSPYFDKPFAFFGHSLGALISFELARELGRKDMLDPAHLFVSGRRAPQLNIVEEHIHVLPEAEFRLKLRQLKNTRKEIIDNPVLMDFIAPMLRADYAIVETYRYSDAPPLNCSITAFGGLQDADDNEEQIHPWQTQTTGGFSFYMLPGDHFFIHTAQKLILEKIAQKLQSWNR